MSLLEVLGLNVGNLNVSLTLGQRSASWNDSVLHRRASTFLLPRKEAAAGLHGSMVAARQAIEDSTEVPTSELEDILEKLRDLENQVEGLLGDDEEDAVEVTTTTENAQTPDGDLSEEDSAPDADENDNEDDGNIPGGAMFKEKVQVETEVMTSTMDDMTSTVTRTRTMTETITTSPDDPIDSVSEAPSEPSPEPAVSSSDSSTSVTQPTPKVRLGAAFKEADQPFSASNATAVQLNVAKPSKIPGDVISAPPTSMPVPAVKQFHKAMYTNSSMSSGFQTVTLPGAQ